MRPEWQHSQGNIFNNLRSIYDRKYHHTCYKKVYLAMTPNEPSSW